MVGGTRKDGSPGRRHPRRRSECLFELSDQELRSRKRRGQTRNEGSQEIRNRRRQLDHVARTLLSAKIRVLQELEQGAADPTSEMTLRQRRPRYYANYRQLARRPAPLQVIL